jgi:hypothetical protein
MAAAAPPDWFRRPLNCSRNNYATQGSDFVICAFPDLISSEAGLEQAYYHVYSVAKTAAGGEKELREQIEWNGRFGPSCGLPAFGRPSTEQINAARDCVLSALRNRAAELNTKLKFDASAPR